MGRVAAFKFATLFLMFCYSCQASQLGVIIPAYFHYGSSEADYGRLLTSASMLGDKLSIVLNPKDGPIDNTGEFYGSYEYFCRKARALGARVFGYVHTGYGNRGVGPVNRDVDKWYDNFMLDGIFFDEASLNDYWHYNNLVAYAKLKASTVGQRNPKIVLNSGIVDEASDERFLELADTIVIYEEEGAVISALNMPTWAANHDSKKFALLAHTADNFREVTATARANDVFWVYSTDINGTASNPWGTLSSYWHDFVVDVADGATPNNASLDLLVPAYFDMINDDSSFQHLVLTASSMGERLSIILNPNVGPITSEDPFYHKFRSFADSTRAHGAKVLGYVDSGYGEIPDSTFNRNVDKWYDNFEIDGIFFDRSILDDNHYWHYNNLQAYVGLKSDANDQASPTIVLCPAMLSSTGIEKRFLNYADLIVIKVDTAAEVMTFISPEWMKDLDPSSFALLAHSGKPDDYLGVMSTARANNIGVVYTTDSTESRNTWGELPSDWDDFVYAILMKEGEITYSVEEDSEDAFRGSRR